jgi:lysozyme
MDISKRGLELIRSYEGYSATAYLCPEKVWTIGYGSIRWDAKTPVKPGDTITRERAEHLLLKEVQLVEDAIDSAVKVPLTQGQFDALCSWGYNVGVGWINGKRKGGAATLIKLLNQGKYDRVPGELVKFKRGANSKKALGGLLKRRQRELRELWFADYAPASQTANTPIADVPLTDPLVAPMPQGVTIEAPSRTDAVKESPTAISALWGILTTLGLIVSKAWEFIFGVARDAGAEVVTQQPLLGPFEALFRVIGLNMETAALFLVLGSFLVVLMRKINDGRA